MFCTVVGPRSPRGAFGQVQPHTDLILNVLWDPSPRGAFGQVQPHRDFTLNVLYSGGTPLSPWGFWPGPATQGLHSNCPVQWWDSTLPVGLLARSSHTGTSLLLSCTVVGPRSPPGAFGQVQPHRDFTLTVLYHSRPHTLCRSEMKDMYGLQYFVRHVLKEVSFFFILCLQYEICF